MGCTLQTPAVLYLSLGCVLFNIFINGLEEAMQYTLIKFADDKRLRVGLLFLGRLEEWINRNSIKFRTNAKLCSGEEEPWAPGQAGTAWLGSSSAEKAMTGSELSTCMNVHQHLHCSSNRILPMECLAEVN